MFAKSQKGFTLIELLIYTGIFSVVAGLMTGILTTTIKINQREASSNEVTSQLNFVMQTIQRLTKESSIIIVNSTSTDYNNDATIGSPQSRLVLRMKDSGGAPTTDRDPITIYTSSSTIKMSQGSGANQIISDLTSNRVVVDQLQFTKHTQYPGHDTVSIDIQLSYNTQNPQAKATRNLTTAIARVSAATFDSNLLPGVDNQYEIGYSTNQRWKNISISNLLNLGQLSVDPVGATNGSIYYNTTSNSFKGYASSTWSTISSLWNSSSTSIYYNGGNVGIGMTNPTSKFVIADQDSQMVFSQTSTYTLIGSAGISNYPTGRDIRLAPGDGFSTTMTIATTGNIGIGTTAPETKLDVAGSIRTNAVSATMDNATWTSLGYSFPANMGHIQVICSNNVNNSGMYIVAHDNGGVSAGLGTVYIGGVGNYWSFRNSAGVLEVKGWDSSQGVTISGRCSIHASR